MEGAHEGLECAVESFDQAVGLWVRRGNERLVNFDALGELGEKLSVELVVGEDVERNTVLIDDVTSRRIRDVVVAFVFSVGTVMAQPVNMATSTRMKRKSCDSMSGPTNFMAITSKGSRGYSIWVCSRFSLTRLALLRRQTSQRPTCAWMSAYIPSQS